MDPTFNPFSDPFFDATAGTTLPPAVFPPNPYGPAGMGSDYAASPSPLGASLMPQPPTSVTAPVGQGGAVPLPQPRPVGPPLDINPPGGNVASANASAPGGANLLNTLRGVQAPKPPDVQKVATPHAPTVRPIGPSELINLLSSLGIGPQQAVGGGLRFGR